MAVMARYVVFLCAQRCGMPPILKGGAFSAPLPCKVQPTPHGSLTTNH